jgi:hypothetical protein
MGTGRARSSQASAWRDAGVKWQRNGETIRVGHFTVDRIEANGTLHAGCHRIYWPEIEQAAIVAGVLQPAEQAAA